MAKRTGKKLGETKRKAKTKGVSAQAKARPEPRPTPRGDEHIEVIARGCLVHGSRVLLCRNLKRGYLYLPGGHVDFAESAARAVEREFLEECGARVRAGELALVSEGAFATKKRWHHEINLVFHVEHGGGVPLDAIRSREEGIGFEWVELAAVQDLDIRPLAAKAWLAAMGSSRGNPTEWVSEVS